MKLCLGQAIFDGLDVGGTFRAVGGLRSEAEDQNVHASNLLPNAYVRILKNFTAQDFDLGWMRFRNHF